MSKSSIIYCILSLLLVAYLCVALTMVTRAADTDTFNGEPLIRIDNSRTDFVDRNTLVQQAGITDEFGTMYRSSLDLEDFETRLRRLDIIESVNVSVLSNGRLAIDVVPMVPVARVFTEGTSYYINAMGKRITADRRHHIDVPVVTGRFTQQRPPERLLPLLSHIAADPSLDALVSTVEQNGRGDIILVPSIRGHVINFGDTSQMAGKFQRLRMFYRNVMPVKGWTFYDTISVKFDGQVVASRRRGVLPDLDIKYIQEDFDEFDDPTETLDLDEQRAGHTDAPA